MRRLFLLPALVMSFLAANAQDTFHEQRATLFELLPVDSTNIVFLGNSLTNGCEWHELIGNPKVIGRGISGDTAPGVYARLDPIVKGHPEKIFLMIGVNDVSHALSADSIATDIAKVLDKITAETPSTKVYLQSCLPFNESCNRWQNLAGLHQVILDLNKNLERMAAERGITWINLYPLFSDGEDNLRKEFTNDGLHLLGPAYMVWKEAVLPYVNE
ncbi:MAG: sialate O-acetylesterase [Muribaculaceae bacterium]|nr:sialate O-acetylesterase [Muribaculaceae bacterium]